MTSSVLKRTAALAALLIAGCAAAPESPELAFWIKPGVRALLPAQPCGIDGAQGKVENAILTATRDGRTERIMTLRACRRGVMTLDVMTLTGMALMSVTYDGRTLESKKHVPLPEALSPEQIVADILMGTLDPKAWSSLPLGYHFRMTENSRTLVDEEGRTVERFIYEGGRLARLERLEHEAFGYSIRFRYLENADPSDNTQQNPAEEPSPL